MFTVLDTRASHGIRQLMKTVFRVYRILRRYRKRLQRIVSYVSLFSIDYKLHVSNDFATVQGLRTAKKKEKRKKENGRIARMKIDVDNAFRSETFFFFRVLKLESRKWWIYGMIYRFLENYKFLVLIFFFVNICFVESIRIIIYFSSWESHNKKNITEIKS